MNPSADSPSGADSEAVSRQLDRAPRGTWTVAVRCECGHPKVIETTPRLEDGTPFPTMWWLTCRRLTTAVSRLESGGMISRVNELLSRDGTFKEKLGSSVENYVAARDVLEVLEGAGHPGGGPQRVKCLHAHVAQQLVDGTNPVGQMTLEAVKDLNFEEPCV